MLYALDMPKKSAKPKLKPSPPAPHVEVLSEDGIALPVQTVVIEEDAEGIYLIRVKVKTIRSDLFPYG